MTDTVLEHLDANRQQIIDRAIEWLAIPSISTDPAYAPRVREAGQWCAEHLKVSGLHPQLLETPGHPVVYATTTDDDVVSPDVPRVLFYGHYDVQPADLDEGWSADPFQPTVRDDNIYARGASDDKGQTLCFLEAIRAWRSTHGKLPCHVTLLIEGEEECGSANLPQLIHDQRERLAADLALVSDTAMWDGPNGPHPAITYALRGLLYFDLKLRGPSRDLHSGVYGGAATNPATILTRILGQLHDDAGRVVIPGFYDQVQSLDQAERDEWASLGFNEQSFFRSIGMETGSGEQPYSPLERKWARPSCDINGLYAGYIGEGAKTVIPAYANAKVSFRLVADQDPAAIAQAFMSWLHEHDTAGCRWEITEHGQAHPVAVERDSRWVRAASNAIEHAAGVKPVLIREGGTIPVVAEFKRQLELDTLLIGLGLASDNIHSPDEHFGTDRLLLGAKIHATLLGQLKGEGGRK